MSDTIPKWQRWARELEALAQTGLTYSQSHYETLRYQRMLAMAAEIVAEHTAIEFEEAFSTFRSQPGYATPKVDVRGAVLRDGKILLVQEISDERWAMPGGWADVGESPAEMVVREVWEESGLEVIPKKVIGVYDANRAGRPMSFFHAYKIVFLCDLIGGSLRGSDETLTADFFSFDDLPPLSSNRTNLIHLEEIQRHLKDPGRRTVFD